MGRARKIPAEVLGRADVERVNAGFVSGTGGAERPKGDGKVRLRETETQ